MASSGRVSTVSGITTSQIAANAVSEVSKTSPTTSGPTTTSTSYATMPEMEVTVNPTATVDLEVDASATVGHNTAGGAVVIGLSLDGGAVPEDAERSFMAAITNAYGCLAVSWVFAGVAAGSHTVRLLWKVSGGTGVSTTYQRSVRVRQRKR